MELKGKKKLELGNCYVVKHLSSLYKLLGFSPAKQNIKLLESLLTVIQCPHCLRCCMVVFDFGPDAIILMWF